MQIILTTLLGIADEEIDRQPTGRILKISLPAYCENRKITATMK
jgi:hypothetical protein